MSVILMLWSVSVFFFLLITELYLKEKATLSFYLVVIFSTLDPNGCPAPFLTHLLLL